LMLGAGTPTNQQQGESQHKGIHGGLIGLAVAGSLFAVAGFVALRLEVSSSSSISSSSSSSSRSRSSSSAVSSSSRSSSSSSSGRSCIVVMCVYVVFSQSHLTYICTYAYICMAGSLHTVHLPSFCIFFLQREAVQATLTQQVPSADIPGPSGASPYGYSYPQQPLPLP
jgi:hypothetical protein